MGGGGSKARAAEANARAAQAQAAAAQHAATQATLKAKYEAESKERVKQLEIQHAKQEAEMAAQREKEKQAHLERLKEMERLREQQNKEMRIKQKDLALRECKHEIDKCNQRINESQQNLQKVAVQYNDTCERVAVLDEKIGNFDGFRAVELDKVKTAIGLSKAQSDFERVDNEIKAAIDLTSVHEDNIAQFLNLTQQLLNATLSNQEQSNKLSAELDTFGELIRRAGSGKLSIEQYFADSNMQRFVPMLAREELTNMNDIICEGDDKEDEFDEIMEVVQTGIEVEHQQWQEQKAAFEADDANQGKEFDRPEPKTKLSLKQRKFFKKSCLNPSDWQEHQKEKIAVTKETLNEISPLLGTFFDRIHVTMKQAQNLLTYTNDPHLNEEQRRAIASVANEDAQNSQNSIKSGAAGAAAGGAQESKQEEKSLEAPSEDAAPSEFDGFEEPPDIADLAAVGQNDGSSQALMNRFDPTGRMFEDSVALNKAAISSIDVVDSMRDEFGTSPNASRALGLAQGIEGTCMEIVRSVGTIRQSLLLAHCVLKMKPANMTETSKKLWTAVDNGLIQIFDNALKMSRVSANYFGFFMKFKQSFSYYLSARDKSLLVSTEHLQNDIKEFKKMSDVFGQQVSVLGDSAMKCIEDCIRNTAGAANFEKNKADFEEKLKAYLEKKKVYDKKQMELDAQYGELLDKRGELKAKTSSMQLVMDSLKRQIEFENGLKNNTQKTMDELTRIIV